MRAGLGKAGGARSALHAGLWITWYAYNIENLYTFYREPRLRTNIEIDDRLMEKAQRLSGLRTKRAVVEAGLQILVRLKEQEEILRLAGKVHWEGDLDQSRQGRGAR